MKRKSKVVKVSAYLAFIIAEATIPWVLRIIDEGIVFDAIYYSSTLILLLALMLLILNKEISIKLLLKQQGDYLLSYVLGLLNAFFAWNIYKLREQRQNTSEAWVTYISIFTCNFVYSIAGMSKLHFWESIVLLGCAILKLFAYACQTQQIILKEDLHGEVKDFYLIFMATQTAIYVFYIEQVRKSMNHKKTQKESLLETMSD